MAEFELFAFGSNSSGQLGIGHLEDVTAPVESKFDDRPNTVPASVAAGGSHTLLVDSTGVLLASGKSTNGRCSDENTSDQVAQFTTFRFNHGSARIRLCTATWEASFLVTDANELLVQGSGWKGELGLGQDVTEALEVQQVSNFPPNGTSIVDIAACAGHVVVVLSNGEAFGWGNGRKGQLGKPEAVCWSPRRIAGVEFEIVEACCGREFTVLIGDPKEGHVLVLGSDKWNVVSQAPPKISNWSGVATSWGSIYVQYHDGTVQSWGRNDHGQLAPSDLPRLSMLAVGSEHALGLTVENKVLAWGWGEHGNCGLPIDDSGDVKDKFNEIYIPKALNGSKVVKIAAGCATSFVWLER